MPVFFNDPLFNLGAEKVQFKEDDAAVAFYPRNQNAAKQLQIFQPSTLPFICRKSLEKSSAVQFKKSVRQVLPSCILLSDVFFSVLFRKENSPIFTFLQKDWHFFHVCVYSTWFIVLFRNGRTKHSLPGTWDCRRYTQNRVLSPICSSIYQQ